MEGIKNIIEWRKLWVELWELKEKKEKLIDENGNIIKVFLMVFKFIMFVNSVEKERY